MFTGLVEAIGRVISVAEHGDVTAVRVSAPFASELNDGASVCVSGVCTSVISHDSDSFTVQLSRETLKVSRFGSLLAGDPVNLERALPVSGRLDGHIVAGHVDGTAIVLSLRKTQSSAELRLSLPESLMRYVVHKGSICVDGVSLTVASVLGNTCTVAVIPETLTKTTLGNFTAGKKVNIETDILGRYVEKLLGLAPAGTSPSTGLTPSQTSTSSGLTREKLAQMGW